MGYCPYMCIFCRSVKDNGWGNCDYTDAEMMDLIDESIVGEDPRMSFTHCNRLRCLQALGIAHQDLSSDWDPYMCIFCKDFQLFGWHNKTYCDKDVLSFLGLEALRALQSLQSPSYMELAAIFTHCDKPKCLRALASATETSTLHHGEM